jgi:serine/threonine-protein kinase
MKAQCPSCETAYRIDDSKIPEKGIHARCPKCQTRIFLKKEESLQLENSSRDEFVCPKCGLEQPESESCVKCGIIYAKYEQNTQRNAAWQSQTPAAFPASDKASTGEAEDMKWKKSIRNACIAGTISGVLTLLVTLISASGVDIPGLDFDLWNLFDVLLIFGLTFGIYKKNRVCAALMLVYFVGSKVLMWQESGSVSGLSVAALFGYFFLQGILGTFAYHRTHETTHKEYGIIKIITSLVLLVIAAGAGIHIYESKYTETNYAGANEPGYYYPDEIRESFLFGCKKGFEKEVKKSGTSVPDGYIEQLCECVLGEFENRYSYEEFDNKYAKAAAQSAEHLPPELEDALEDCVNQLGY